MASMPTARRLFSCTTSPPPSFSRLDAIEPLEITREAGTALRTLQESIQRLLEEDRVPTFVIGELRQGEPGVEFVT
jgi:hypothetical protein